MKRWVLGIWCCMWYAAVSMGQGIPFIRNFTPAEYHGNSMNFDVEIGDDGTVYVANFEGVLYYDNVEWRIIHTPDINRVTVVYKDHEGTVWVGGYNYFGRIATKANGQLALQRVGSPSVFRGEVQEIWEQDGAPTFLVNNGYIYKVKDNQVAVKSQVSKEKLKTGLTDVVQTDALVHDNKVVLLTDIVQEEPVDGHLKALLKKGRGLTIADDNGHELYTITEKNGLCSDNVSYIAYNGHGQLWGVTENGIFRVAVPSAYSHYTANEGLTGAVMSMAEFDNHIYVGTSDGLFRINGQVAEQVGSISYGCWSLATAGPALIAATANGIYRISPDGSVRQLTTTSATSLLAADNHFYSGETDGVFLTQPADNSRRQVSDQGRVTKIVIDGDGTLWLQNLYGEIWYKTAGASSFKRRKTGEGDDAAATIVETGRKVEIVSYDAMTPFPYPLVSYINKMGVVWLTDADGKSLYRWKDGQRLTDIDRLLNPIGDVAVRSLYQQENLLWIGSDNGVTVLDIAKKDSALLDTPRLLFRQVVLNGDSVLWGGYGELPKRLTDLASNERNLRFTYAMEYTPMVGKTLYRYKLNNGDWSIWADDNDAEFLNLSYGAYTMTIQARLANGQLSEEASLDFYIAYPFYMRWYMNVIYALLLLLLAYVVFRYRLRRLEQERNLLENVVQERTAEVVKQKDEIEEKSKSLELALNELHQAQGELIRQEKMATVGKLTQGLIDRILNPLNYINNFSKLSEGLVKDIEANIKDEKDALDQENYEDTMDVLDMLRGNLQKVGEHGLNTTRTLKAMEEMLKDRSGGIVPMNLTAVLRQDEDMLNTYYAKDIAQYGVKVTFGYPADTPLSMNGNADQLSKTIMSMLGNAVYAVVKKAQREKFQPEVSLQASQTADGISISIRDNGIGIEDTILDKVFDPFFTTKTTGEAAGVGLYLSREIIQNHGGDISVASVKNEYSEFTITLPAQKT